MSVALMLSVMLARAAPLEAQLHEVAALAGEPSIVAAAGIARGESAIPTVENPAAFDPSDSRRRILIVGLGDQASTADAVFAAVRWFKTRAPAALRRRWAMSALPAATFDPADTQSLLRWITFQAPDLVVTVGGDDASLRDNLKTVPYNRIQIGAAASPVGGDLQAVPTALAKILAPSVERSALHEEILARVGRDPLAIARVLANRYPEMPSISYIPAVSWVNALTLASKTDDSTLTARVVQHLKPWLVDGRKPFGDRIQLTAVAGMMVFAELPSNVHLTPTDGATAERLAGEAAALAATEKSPGVAQYGGGWTDDMFMAASVLARTGRSPARAQDLDVAARYMIAYAGRLQRADGLFNHAPDAPAAWGRGNGFAAMGLTETLTALPLAHPDRPAVLAIYRRQMAAVRAQQSPDGSWREIVDEPGAYREETATAMLMTAMARGVRSGWLDASYRSGVDRAWRALAAHVTADGGIIDVCASTAGGTTRRYYLDRPAVTGADDRGAAMALMAAMEISER